MRRLMIATLAPTIALTFAACEQQPSEAPHVHGCGDAYHVDPRDATMRGQHERILVSGGETETTDDDVYDLAMPREVRDWLHEQDWPRQHDEWHNIRRLDSACRRSNATWQGPDGQPDTADDCVPLRNALARGLWRADVQEGAPGDGYAFLAMHRHMIDGLRQAFPSHVDLFRGWRHVPRSAEDPENEMPWIDPRWSAGQLEAFERLEHIEENVDEFESEDELGWYIQVNYRWTSNDPQELVSDPSAGIHNAGLHAAFSVPGSPVALGEGRVNVEHALFWRLHGWIDEVWHRYRAARGLSTDEPAYRDALRAQCEEMHLITESLEAVEDETTPPPEEERGVFHETVRPFLDARCGGCHGPAAPTLGLVLGGTGVRSADIVAGLVGQRSVESELVFVEPGDPDRSWLVRKIEGDFEGVVCPTACGDVMPPAGARVTDDELAALRAWISSGAEAP